MRLETSGGASLLLHASETLASAAATTRLSEQVTDVLMHRLPVAITVDGLGTRPEECFASVCGILRASVEVASTDAAFVSLAIDAGILAPGQLWRRRCEALGPGPLYLLVGSAFTPPARQAELRRRQDEFWLQCWQLRNSQQLRMALAPMISSPCPLLPAETALGILPPFGLQVPPGTAWIQIPLNITHYVDTHGELDIASLHACLRHCIESGEALHDETAWLTAAMRHDAWLNRRLAISLSGIGDLAVLRGLDPTCFRTLQELAAVLHDVRDVVVTISRELATQTEPAPSLDMIDPCRSADWQARWSKALEFAAMRHRNLLAMSPWAVFPSSSEADSRYCDLLPLLEYADACSFPRPPCLRSWNINEFKYFHHRVSAVLGRKDARQLIAEQV